MTRCGFCETPCSSKLRYMTPYRGPDEEICRPCFEQRRVGPIDRGARVSKEILSEFDLRRIRGAPDRKRWYVYIGEDGDRSEEAATMLFLTLDTRTAFQ